MKAEAVVDAALARIERERDGSVPEHKLIDAVAEMVSVDIEAEKRKKAKRLVESRTRPGSSNASGQLVLPLLGNDPYSYEPQRLVRGPGVGEQRGLLEQDAATPVFKNAEWRAAKTNRERVERWERRKAEEASHFAEWYIEKLEAGAGKGSLTFGNFVRDVGWWKPGEAPREELPETD